MYYNFALLCTNEKLNFIYLFKSIITNPLIIACVVEGINFLGIQLPVIINNTLEVLVKQLFQWDFYQLDLDL